MLYSAAAILIRLGKDGEKAMLVSSVASWVLLEAVPVAQLEKLRCLEDNRILILFEEDASLSRHCSWCSLYKNK